MKLFTRLVKAVRDTKPNSTPSALDGQPVQDKHGKIFWLRTDLYEDGGHVIWLGQPGRNVGCAKLHRDAPSSCAIADLKIDERYRDRGLGTILVKEVFRLAEDDGVELLWGWVTLADFLSTKHLLDWYLRRGFQVHYDEAEIERLLSLSREEQEQLAATIGTRTVAKIRKMMRKTIATDEGVLRSFNE
jgi:N-acetylglutamate synthase-like GNAT family acetyltransferase